MLEKRSGVCLFESVRSFFTRNQGHVTPSWISGGPIQSMLFLLHSIGSGLLGLA